MSIETKVLRNNLRTFSEPTDQRGAYREQLQDLQPQIYCNRSVCHQLAFPGCCRNFLEAHLLSESPSPQPHPVTLLGPRIFRALRLGPFEGFPDGIARRLARRLPPQSGSHPKAGSLEPPVPAKGSDSSPNAYRKTSIGRGATSIVHISSEPYNVLISAKNLVVCTQLYRIIQGFHKR